MAPVVWDSAVAGTVEVEATEVAVEEEKTAVRVVAAAKVDTTVAAGAMAAREVKGGDQAHAARCRHRSPLSWWWQSPNETQPYVHALCTHPITIVCALKNQGHGEGYPAGETDPRADA